MYILRVYIGDSDGGVYVAVTRRIMICVPESLLEEMDNMTGNEHMNRSEFMREAVRFYLAEKKKSQLREQMRRGYLEMSQINLVLAQEAYVCEEEVNLVIESKLMECS